MKRLLEIPACVALVQGALGLVQEVTGPWHGWGVVQRFGFRGGHEIHAGVALVVLSFALFAAAGRRGSG